MFYHLPAKKPDESERLKYRTWKKNQDELLYKFQAKWFEVVMKESCSESTCSPFGLFSESEEQLAPESLRKSESGNSFSGEWVYE